MNHSFFNVMEITLQFEATVAFFRQKHHNPRLMEVVDRSMGWVTSEASVDNTDSKLFQERHNLVQRMGDFDQH